MTYIVSGECGQSGAARELHDSTSGTWRVLQGGGPGDLVDVEVRDVSFPPRDGHTLYIHYLRFHVRMPTTACTVAPVPPECFSDAAGADAAAVDADLADTAGRVE